MLHLIPPNVWIELATRVARPRDMISAWLSCRASMEAMSQAEMYELIGRHCMDMPHAPSPSFSWLHEVSRLGRMCSHCFQRPHAQRCVRDRCASCCRDPECARHTKPSAKRRSQRRMLRRSPPTPQADFSCDLPWM